MSSDGPRRWLRPVLGAITGIALFSMGYVSAAPGLGFGAEPRFTVMYDVLADGQQIGRVDNPAMAPKVLADILAAASIEQGTPVTAKESVDVSEVRAVHDAHRLNEQQLAAQLRAVLTLNSYAVALRVNGRDAVYVTDRATAEDLVAKVQDHFNEQLANGSFPPPGKGRMDETVQIVEVGITEQVEIIETAAPPKVVAQTLDQALTILLQGTDEIQTHTVQQGESFWTIASHNNMSVSSLEAANPTVGNPNRIQIGDELKLVVPTPHVTVHSEEIREFDRTIPFSTQYVYDENMWPWENRVRQPGRSGLAHVTERIIRKNGIVVAQEVLADQVLTAEQTQVVVRGSKVVPNQGTGKLIWPLNAGRVSSRYGWRGGRLHGGVDIAAPRGTAIMAADSGVVTAAGVRSAFGQMVSIDHGGGHLVTLYAHMSVIKTRVGAKVEKGEVIGLVGCTGRCTGPHLHFEIHIGGKRVDPLKYYADN